MFQRGLRRLFFFVSFLLFTGLLVAEAWHTARTLDPLLDSDDDENADYNVRIDVSECLWLVAVSAN